MNRMESLWDVTKKLETALETEVNGKNREKVLQEVNALLEAREEILSEIVPPFTETEMHTGSEIVRLNNELQVKLNTLFNELKTEMKQAKKQKKSHRSYLNPYENVKIADGMFLDSKN